jgi:hypothetical protein
LAVRFWPEGGDWGLVAFGFLTTDNRPLTTAFGTHHPLPRYLLRVYEITQPIAVSAGTLMCDEGKSEVVEVQQLRN